MRNIAILYVGIGPYVRLWEDFYSSCEQFFLRDFKKHYYLVTDSKIEETSKVTIIHQDDLGWPGNVVFRYLFFLRIKDTLAKYDYAFFFNGNTRFMSEIMPEDVLPTKEDGGLIALTWKNGNEDADVDYRFERRPQSASFIPYGTTELYLQSGITGGLVNEYIELLDKCHELTMKDFANGIIPVVHDESVYNKYMLNRNKKILTSTYGLPSQWDRHHNAKIVFLKKEKVLGHNYLRNLKKRPHTETWLVKLLKKVRLMS